MNNVLDTKKFNQEVLECYNRGCGDGLNADMETATSFVPIGTSELRDFSYIAPEIPEFNPANCVGCMECVTECPDTAILGKVVEANVLKGTDTFFNQFAKTKKYWENFERKGEKPGYFGIYIDPTKCKGCAECVTVCGDRKALKMIKKDPEKVQWYRDNAAFFKKLPETPRHFIIEKSLMDMMLAERSLLFTGGAGSCMGCGEASAIRMMLAATGFVYGAQAAAIVASTGCNSVFGSTYPYNPYKVPWTNSLFENSPAVALGVRLMWDKLGYKDKRLWVFGGDGALFDIGFQALSRLLISGKDIKVLVLDTQAYSNTGGQASGSTFMSQETKLSFVGKEIKGKTEKRKELAQICMMHPDVFVAQTTPAHYNHFYKTIMAANEYPGPAVVIAYATCMPEHGVADDKAGEQARIAVNSRAFPLMIYDPRKGKSIKERLDLKANPSPGEDWWHNPKTGEVVDFIYFAKTEGRFAKHFDKEGNPSIELRAAQQDRLDNWYQLQELAGLR